MRSKNDVENFKYNVNNKYIFGCKICGGVNHSCECRKKARYEKECYEACIPKKLWYVSDDKVVYNRELFNDVIVKYVGKIKTMRKYCRGLFFNGSNGVGKTFFASYILTRAIEKGLSTYYSTMINLERNTKNGFTDHVVRKRLEYMLTSDFLVIDEIGKERSKRSNSFVDSVLEDIIKRRMDDGLPTILITNLDGNEFKKQYGETIGSLLSGSFDEIFMGGIDLRPKVKADIDVILNATKPKEKPLPSKKAELKCELDYLISRQQKEKQEKFGDFDWDKFGEELCK